MKENWWLVQLFFWGGGLKFEEGGSPPLCSIIRIRLCLSNINFDMHKHVCVDMQIVIFCTQ